MLPALYRLWASTRLAQLEPWVDEWCMEEMYAGVGGQGAADAAYASAVLLEHCKLRGMDVSGGAAAIFKYFDQVNRTLVYEILEKAGIPKRILQAYNGFQETLRAYFIIAGVSGKPTQNPPVCRKATPCQ